jgi:alpha-L-rhamnosidase
VTALPLTPAGLRCTHRVDPLGVAPDRVRLSWRLEGAGTGRIQRAYQVLVTDDEDAVAWDSGRVESAATADIAYGGPPLTAGGRYRWKVRVWDEGGRASDWSEPARFEVELDQTDGWHASWIGPSPIRDAAIPPSGAGPVDPVARALTPAPYLRRVFTVGQPVTSARLYVTALGLYEARLNGRRVGDGFLTPGWTDYSRRIAYQTYDVTGMLAEGENVLGAILADGWYAGFYGFDPKRAGAHYGEAPELLAELVLRLADGSEQRIVTDGQWESSAGSIRHADLLMGERHDLVLEPSGWDMPGFGARDWRPVQVRERDATALVASPPTARSAMNGSAGSATPRSSPAPPATTATSPRSSPSGWTTWPTPSCPPGPSPTSPPGLPSPDPGRRPGATPG